MGFLLDRKTGVTNKIVTFKLIDKGQNDNLSKVECVRVDLNIKLNVIYLIMFFFLYFVKSECP
jgi:hypothetical protein